MTTGASVQTYGIGCTTPAQWVDGPNYIPVDCAKSTTLDFIDEAGKMIQSKAGQDKPRLSELKNSFKPTIIIISLGTNIEGYVGNKDAYDARIRASADLAKQAVDNGAKCYWIGPPKRKSEADVSKVATVVAGLKTVVESIVHLLIPVCLLMQVKQRMTPIIMLWEQKNGRRRYLVRLTLKKIFQLLLPSLLVLLCSMSLSMVSNIC